MSANKHPVCTTTFPMSHGGNMPAVGLGTWQGSPGSSDAEQMKASIIHSLKDGYRLIDTAQAYGVESVVGDAIRSSGVLRGEICVVTKLWQHHHHDPAAALEISLRELNVEYIDVFLMHWPNATTADGETLRKDQSPTFVETWKLMEPLVGPKCRAIGVSNFSQTTLTELLETAEVVPAVNQVELHALNPNLKLVPFCQTKGIHVMSWSTLGGSRTAAEKNPIMNDALFVDLAKKYDCSVGVVSLSWAVQRGVTVIPKSSSHSRISDNIRLVKLSEEDLEAVNQASSKLGKLRLADGIKIGRLDGNDKTLFGWTYEDFGWEDDKGNWLV